jgi:histone H3/H4
VLCDPESLLKKCPASDFIKRCHEAAEQQLEKHVMALALNPGFDVADGEPWYFPTLVSTLREFQEEWVAARQPEVVTSIGEMICEAAEYAVARRKLVIIDGMARIGKTHATKTWCGLNPSTMRYVQVPSSNDDLSFFREIAKSLGVASSVKYKAWEFRARIEEVLQDGQLGLALDEAHYLFTNCLRPTSLPTRLNWIMTALVNFKVPVVLITTPQFFRSLSAIERATCWNSDQFKGRIGRYIKLPDALSRDELQEVAGVLLPAADTKSRRALALYAESSGKYLGALEAVADTALYLCESDARREVEFKDVERAIRESVTPSDEALKAALASATETKRQRVSRVTAMASQSEFAHDAAPAPGINSQALEGMPARQMKPEKLEISPG